MACPGPQEMRPGALNNLAGLLCCDIRDAATDRSRATAARGRIAKTILLPTLSVVQPLRRLGDSPDRLDVDEGRELCVRLPPFGERRFEAPGALLGQP